MTMGENEKHEKEQKRKRNHGVKDVFNTRSKRGAGYFLLVLLEFYLFSILLNGAMEYYVTDSPSSFKTYVIDEYFMYYFFGIPESIFSFPDVSSQYFYHSYAIILFLIVLLFVFFVFQRSYIAIITSGTLGMLLCYASKIKFQYRMELLNIRDLALTEAAGMVELNIDEEWYPTMLHPNDSEKNIEAVQTIYSVPVVSWSNCWDNNDINMDLANLSVLGARIIQKSKLPMTRMAILENYYESFLAADTLFYIMDANHNIIDRLTEELEKVIRFKSMIAYDQVFGDNISSDAWLPMLD